MHSDTRESAIQNGLMHLPPAQAVVERLVYALKPGGRLLTEACGLSGPPLLLTAARPETAGLVVKVWRAAQAVLSAIGADPDRRVCAASGCRRHRSFPVVRSQISTLSISKVMTV
ncbi:hypothetical protein OH768_53250 [Streptomyces sp. NBC_01622]|uniref:hypothetical protein n=1 Tax=Streptomyces sp. NBC_01622 TaxID=2975903 RepID=UPI003866C876|nr:hypothetical protein OH768_53250 [Streptomyces sp. NBC_01622]